MISFRALRLLRRLRKAQLKNINNYVWINRELRTLETVTDSGEASRKVIPSRLPLNWLDICLEELAGEQLIEWNDEYVRVLSSGFTYGEITFRTLIREFVRSILCPIAVALITAVLTLLFFS